MLPAWSNFWVSFSTDAKRVSLKATVSWSLKPSRQYEFSFNWVMVPMKQPERNLFEILRHWSLCIVFICWSRLARAIVRVLFFYLIREISRLTSFSHWVWLFSYLFWYSCLNLRISYSSVSSSTSRMACSTDLVSRTLRIGWTSRS